MWAIRSNNIQGNIQKADNIPPLSFTFRLMILSEPRSTSTTLLTCYYFNITPTPFLSTPWYSLIPHPMTPAFRLFHLLSCTHIIIYVPSLHHNSSFHSLPSQSLVSHFLPFLSLLPKIPSARGSL